MPVAVNGLTRHERLVRAGNLANVAAHGWYWSGGTAAAGRSASDTTPSRPRAASWPWLRRGAGWHHEALVQLQAAAGARLDPAVVRAARAVVAQERVTATEPAPEPRLHRLRVPAPLSRAIASAS